MFPIGAAAAQCGEPEDDQESMGILAALTKERERSLELAKYFTASAVRPANPEIACEITGDPRTAPDSTLTALAQLGTFKLGCQRSFISLIDRSHQYIIGEATKETSLRLPGTHKPDDGLYLGIRALDLSFGVCPQTIKIFTADSDEHDISTANIQADRGRFVIRDFHADPEFASRPYVVGHPFMRSYGEVPLVGNEGLVVGTYCVIDDKPREFNDVEIGMLTEVAGSIMNHLNLLKMKLEFDRVSGLVRSIGSYAAGYQGVDEDPKRTVSRPSTPRSTSKNAKKTVIARPNMARLNSFDRRKAAQAESHSFEERLDSKSKSVSRKPIDNRESSLSGKISSTFSRATRLIQQSMEMQGVVIFDLSTTGFMDTGKSASTVSDSSVASPPPEATKTVNILGSSVAPTGDLDAQVTTIESLDIRAVLLQRMLSRYPLGHIFSFDELGMISGTEAGGDKQNRSHPSHNARDHARTMQGSNEDDDAAELFAAIKPARSVVFAPLWDYQKDRWFGSILCWTTDRSRILELSDLNYLSAFGNSIMAGVSKLEASALSQAKSDFISSISHELRSPLHGILAGTELLRESITSTKDSSLLSTIDACGNMLLDTLENLLDFAKINNLASKRRDSPVDGVVPTVKSGMSKLSLVDLGELVQDVVEGVYLGHSSKRPTRDQSATANSTGARSRMQMDVEDENTMKQEEHNDVAVMIDIEPGLDWTFETEVGMWKRIVMNLFANSLKYTTEGTIRVSLRLMQPVAHPLNGAETPRHICLQITDTGSGISKDYLRDRLFTPFAQENDLSTGTGLGLSIVRQLVDSLRGFIDVQSEIGVGTSISVTLPLGNIIRKPRGHHAEGQRLDPHDRLKGQVLCLPSLSASDTAPDQAFKSSQNVAVHRHFSDIAHHWLGMQVVTVTKPDEIDVKANKEYFSLLHGQGTKALEWSIYMPQREGASLPTSEAVGDVGCPAGSIHPPFGPRTLAVALLHALENKGAPEDAVSPSSSDTITKQYSHEKVQGPEDVLKALPSLPKRISRPQSPARSKTLPSHLDPAGPTMNILLVDDNAVNLRLLSTCVAKAGCKFREATNGLEALRLAKAEDPAFDIIFMDLSMPVMDGFESSREIRRYEGNMGRRRTKIIALTALGNEETKSEAYASGIDLFVSKPVKMRDVRELIAKISLEEGD